MAKSIKDIFQQQRQLIDEKYSQQQDLARQQADQRQATLAESLTQQRQDYLRGQQMVQQGQETRARQMQNQLVGRGLGSSGLQQLGNLQNTLATGRALTDVAEVNRANMSQLTQAQQQIPLDLQNQLRQASIDYQGQTLGANMGELEQRQQQSGQLGQAYMDLLSMAQSGEFNPQQLENMQSAIMASIYGDEESLKNLLGYVDGEQADGTAGSMFSNLNNDEELKGKGGLLKKELSRWYDNWSRLLFNEPGYGSKFKYNVGGQTLELKPDEMANYLKNKTYKNNKYIQNGTIKIVPYVDGAIKFEVNGERYNTLNQAQAKLDAQNFIDE